MCTSSALRVGAPSGHARLGEHARAATTAPNRSSSARVSDCSTGESDDPRVVVAEEAVVVDLGTGAVRASPAPAARAGGRRAPISDAPAATQSSRQSVGIGGSAPSLTRSSRGTPWSRSPARRWGSLGPAHELDVHVMQRKDAIVSPALRRGDGCAASARQVGGRGEHRRREPGPGIGPEPLDRAAHADRARPPARPTRTGALTLATPGLALAHASPPSPEPRTSAEHARRSTSNRSRVVGPREQHPPARALGERQRPRRAARCRAGRVGRSCGRDAHPLVALAHVELRALAGVGAQPLRAPARAGSTSASAAPAAAPQPDEAGAEPEPARRRRAPRARGARARPRAGARSAGRGRSRARDRRACTARRRAIVSRMPTDAVERLHRRATRRSATLSTLLILSSHIVRQEHETWPHADPLREGLGPPRRAPRRGRARPPLHRPAPRARGHLAAGLRRPAPGRPRRAPARPHGRDDGPQRARPPGLDRPLEDPISAKQIEVLARNCEEFGIRCYAMGDPGQGIVHVIGPEQGLTQPGMTIVCGDSHTSTHGAFGALAFGIGTSEVEHVLATQTLPQMRPGTMAITVDGDAARRRHRQGHRARDHRPHRHRRRHRLGHRVPRRARSARSRWKAA